MTNKRILPSEEILYVNKAFIIVNHKYLVDIIRDIGRNICAEYEKNLKHIPYGFWTV